MSEFLTDKDLDVIFRNARSHNKWKDEPVSDVTLQALYDLLRWGPTSANVSPARFVFCRTPEGKERLAKHAMPANADKILAAPVTAIIAQDTKFYELIPQLFPHNPGARDWFTSSPELAEATAFRNSTLQGAYMIIAARALGLDAGPMSGFNNASLDADFFPDGRFKSNFICSLGHGDPAGLFARSPRLAFDEACQLL